MPDANLALSLFYWRFKVELQSPPQDIWPVIYLAILLILFGCLCAFMLSLADKWRP